MGDQSEKSRLQPRVLQNDKRLFGKHDGCRRCGALTTCFAGPLAVSLKSIAASQCKAVLAMTFAGPVNLGLTGVAAAFLLIKTKPTSLTGVRVKTESNSLTGHLQPAHSANGLVNRVSGQL